MRMKWTQIYDLEWFPKKDLSFCRSLKKHLKFYFNFPNCMIFPGKVIQLLGGHKICFFQDTVVRCKVTHPIHMVAISVNNSGERKQTL